MKKTISLLLALLMIASFIPALAVSSNADATTVDFLAEGVLKHTVNGATWTRNEDGSLTGNGDGDNAIFSEVKVPAGQHVYIEATAKLDERQAWGIIFSGDTANAFGNLWYCYNIDSTVPNSRLFKVNPFQEFFRWDSEMFRDGQYHTLAMEFMGNGVVKFYYDNDIKYVITVASEMENMYIGAMVCNSKTTFKSFTMETERTGAGYEFKNTLGYTDLLADGVINYKAGDGSYTVENGVLTAPNRDKGDTFMTSDVRVEKGQHVFIEATATMEAKDRDSAWGILFAAEKENPGVSWLCLNVDGASSLSRLFNPGNGSIGRLPVDNYPFVLDTIDNKCEKAITLGIEITEDGTVYTVCNGMPTGKTVINDWNGAYVGLMTWFSSATITSAKVYEIGNFEASVETDSQTIDAGETVTITANAPIDSVTVGNDLLVKGTDYTVEGNTVIISADFTSGLAAGTYPVTVTSANNNAVVRFTVNASADQTDEPANTQTGDIAAIVIAAVATMSLAGVAVVASKRKIDR